MTAALTVLAAGGVGAGMSGFLVVVGLIVAAAFLFRSMNRHLRRVPQDFPPGGAEQGGATGPVGEEPRDRAAAPAPPQPRQSSRD